MVIYISFLFNKFIFIAYLCRILILISFTLETTMIFWDGEKALPEQAGNFKKYLKNYLAKLNYEYLLDDKKFNYDSTTDEFLDTDIQEFYHLWTIA